MKILLLEKNSKKNEKIRETIRHFANEKGITIDVDIVVACTNENIQVEGYYDGYFIRVCKECLQDSISFVEKQRKRNPNALFIYVSTADNLIFDVQRIQPFYFIRNTLMKKDLLDGLELLYKHLYRETILVSKQNEDISVNVDDICSVEIDDHYLNIYTEHEEYMIRETLGNFVSKYKFIQVSRSQAVNPKHILMRTKNSITLKNKQQYKISKKYENVFQPSLVSSVS